MPNKAMIYIIDDDPIFKLVARKILERNGSFTSLHFYNNGQEGLTALLESINENTTEVPGTIFLDIEMPVLNGWGFMEAFVQIPEEKRIGINVYIVSSSIVDSDKEKAASYREIKDYIVKPLSKEALAQIAHW